MILLGIKTVAIDLPNYKESKLVQIPRNKPAYLEFVINQFEILRERRIILLAPSMSGGYALPYIINGMFHILYKNFYIRMFMAMKFRL